MKKTWIGLAAILMSAPAAWADNVAHCEALIMQAIPSEDGLGEARIASYRPAVDFLMSLYDEEEGHLAKINGYPIRAIMCRRNDVIPSESDYKILETGLPFVLSQNFDSSDTDSLTVYWKEDTLDYVYKGHPLSEEAQDTLEIRLADFSARGKVELNVDDIDTNLDSEAQDGSDDSESPEKISEEESPEESSEENKE